MSMISNESQNDKIQSANDENDSTNTKTNQETEPTETPLPDTTTSPMIRNK